MDYIVDYIIKTAGQGNPIRISDIVIEGKNKNAVRVKVSRLVKEGVLRRFSNGVYYIPKTNSLGRTVPLSREAVINNSFVCNDDKTIGYYSGSAFLNRIGLSSQIPIAIEIKSNKATKSVETKEIEGLRFIIRKPRVQITQENERVLPLLDALYDFNKIEVSEEDAKTLIRKYIADEGITSDQILQYASYYPDKIYKGLYLGGILNAAA